jgi:FkbM family methyltransferase
MLRERIRRLRLYYRSRSLFRQQLADPAIADWLPWQPAGRRVVVRFRSGREFRMPAAQWPLLPSACRLERIGADFEFLDDAKRVSLDGVTLYSPLWTRDEAAYYKEVLLDDAYGIKGRDFAGRTVVDIGAYVGDSTVAFARQGAHVHAIEPSESYCRFIRRNISENGFAARVVLHAVGLAERKETVLSRHDRLNLVEGVDYAIEHLPGNVELLKLDCEGAEYHLLGDARFLGHLAPREIHMEYHRGHAGVVGPLERAGYAVTLKDPAAELGLAVARRKR